MKPRKRALTAQIKPATRNAIMDQLAAAADEIERLRRLEILRAQIARPIYYRGLDARRRWWHRFAWWRK